MELLLRFVIGGALVTLFAALGDTLRPKSFAGLLGAAPSVALATVALTIRSDGAAYAAVEARSMIIGAAAFMLYAWVVSRVMWRSSAPAPLVTLAGLLLWLAIAVGGWYLLLGRTT